MNDDVLSEQRDVEWDEDKNEYNQKAHGVAFEEAATMFSDPLEITFPDPEHSLEESRFLSVGESSSGRVLIVSYTERSGKIRVISARKPTRGERKFYEENKG